MAFAHMSDRSLPEAATGDGAPTASGAMIYSLALARAKRKHEALAACHWNGHAANSFDDEDFGDFPPCKA